MQIKKGLTLFTFARMKDATTKQKLVNSGNKFSDNSNYAIQCRKYLHLLKTDFKLICINFV